VTELRKRKANTLILSLHITIKTKYHHFCSVGVVLKTAKCNQSAVFFGANCSARQANNIHQDGLQVSGIRTCISVSFIVRRET
jgi:hypothetical protein